MAIATEVKTKSKDKIPVHCAFEKLISLEELVENPKNPNTHPEKQIELLANIIAAQGFRVPITVSKRSGFIVRGHARLKAARLLGLEAVPVDFQDYKTEAAEWADLIADNRLAELAKVDDDLLKDLLKELPEDDLNLTGFDEDEIAAILAEVFDEEDINEFSEGETDSEAGPEVKPGDVYRLGEHLLMCGDSSDYEQVMKILNKQQINVCVTSPPYAMQRKEEYGGIDPKDYPEWFGQVAAIIQNVLAKDGSFFLNIKEHVEDGERSLYVKKLVIYLREQIGFKYIDELVWQKPGFPGHWNNRLANSFEPVFWFTMGKNFSVVERQVEELQDGQDETALIDEYGTVFHFSKEKKIKFNPKRVGKMSPLVRSGKRKNDKSKTTGNWTIEKDRTKTVARPGNVLRIKGNQEQIAHPAMFPISLPEFFIRLVTEKGDSVFDPFSGSGTTLMAAEKLGRRCFAMEIKPEYVQETIKRWEMAAGKTAELV